MDYISNNLEYRVAILNSEDDLYFSDTNEPDYTAIVKYFGNSSVIKNEDKVYKEILKLQENNKSLNDQLGFIYNFQNLQFEQFFI